MTKKTTSDIRSTEYFASTIAANFARSLFYLLETSCEVYSLGILQKVISHAEKHFSRVQKLKDVVEIISALSSQPMNIQARNPSSIAERFSLPFGKSEEKKESLGTLNEQERRRESSFRCPNAINTSFFHVRNDNGSNGKRQPAGCSEPVQPISSPSSSSVSFPSHPRESTTFKGTFPLYSYDSSKMFSLPTAHNDYCSSSFFYLPPAFSFWIKSLREKSTMSPYLFAFLASGFTTFIVIKYAIVCALREVGELYGELSHALRYWRWAPYHRLKHFLHCGFCVPRIVKRLGSLFDSSMSFSGTPPSLPANMRIFVIRSHLRVVITLIGGLYSLLYRTQLFFDYMQDRVGRRVIDPDELCWKMHQEIFQLLSGIKRSFEESRDQLLGTAPQWNSTCLARETNVVDEVLDTEWDCIEEEDNVLVETRSERSQSAFPAGITPFQGASSRRVSVKKTTNPRLFLLSVMKTLSDILDEMRSQSKIYSPPLLASHARLVLLSSSLLTIVLTILLRYTPEDVYQTFSYSNHMALQLFHLYGVLPAKSILESLLYSRPGVDTRIAAFRKEAKALAQTITDYHADYVTSMNSFDLEQLHHNTYDALIRGDIEEEGFRRINEHYQHSLRHPLRGLIYGHLPRLLLIRMSMQALEITRVVNGIDEVLDSNRLNFQVMTIIPIFAVGLFCAGWFWWKWKRTITPVHLQLRLRWREVHRILNEEIPRSPDCSHSLRRQRAHAESQTGDDCNSSIYRTPITGVSLKLKTSLQSPPTLPQAEISEEKISGLPYVSALGEGERVPKVHPVVSFPSNKLGRDEEYSPISYSSYLNNYEQGLLLLSVHEMRIATKWFLQNYNLYEELLDDLEMIESDSLSRHHRLEVLHRMRITHKFL